MTRAEGVIGTLQFLVGSYIAVAYRFLDVLGRKAYGSVFFQLLQASLVIEESPTDEVETSTELASEFFRAFYVGNLFKQFVGCIEVFQIPNLSSLHGDALH